MAKILAMAVPNPRKFRIPRMPKAGLDSDRTACSLQPCAGLRFECVLNCLGDLQLCAGESFRGRPELAASNVSGPQRLRRNA